MGKNSVSYIIICAALLSFLLLVTPSMARDVTFFHISDQHYNIDEKAPAAEQQKRTEAEETLPETIEHMNELPGTPYPDRVGGTVKRPRGVILTGDLTNDGTRDEMERWILQWGLKGGDGLLDYPVYEGTGNHDGREAVRRTIIERNPDRPDVTGISENGFHYSWDWDDVHFVQLNEYAGPEDDTRYDGNPAYGRKRQSYGNPAGKSLQFLREDLASHVGDSKRPVILMQHYGFGGFPLRPWGNDAAWWTEEHAMRLWEAIEGYNVISILSGHDGSEAVIDWNGIPNRHMDDAVRFGVYHLGDEKMTIAVRNSKSQAWQSIDEQPLLIDSSLPGSLVSGPYLVYNGDPNTMTVLWRTPKAADCTLHWGDDRFMYEDGQVEVEPWNAELHLYKHTITGLKPNTCITYALEIDGKYAPGMFYSAPAGEEKVKFLVAGEQDSQTNRNQLFNCLYDKIYEDPAYHSILLLPGDLVTSPTHLRSWDDDFFSRQKDDRHMRWMQSRMPLVVPQDHNQAREILFPVEGGQAAGYYSLDYGPVTFIVLNAEESLEAESTQNEWLQRTLEHADTDWRVAMYNAPEDKTKALRFTTNFHSITDIWDVDLCILGNADSKTMTRNSTTYISPGSRSIAVTVEGGKMVCELFEANGNAIDTITLGLASTRGIRKPLSKIFSR